MSIAITPRRKKKNEVMRYRRPTTWWSVEDSQYARMCPCAGLLRGADAVTGCSIGASLRAPDELLRLLGGDVRLESLRRHHLHRNNIRLWKGRPSRCGARRRSASSRLTRSSPGSARTLSCSLSTATTSRQQHAGHDPGAEQEPGQAARAVQAHRPRHDAGVITSAKYPGFRSRITARSAGHHDLLRITPFRAGPMPCTGFTPRRASPDAPAAFMTVTSADRGPLAPAAVS